MVCVCVCVLKRAYMYVDCHGMWTYTVIVVIFPIRYPRDLRGSDMIVEQLTKCCLLHPDDCGLVKRQIDTAIAEHTASLGTNDR